MRFGMFASSNAQLRRAKLRWTKGARRVTDLGSTDSAALSLIKWPPPPSIVYVYISSLPGKLSQRVAKLWILNIRTIFELVVLLNDIVRAPLRLRRIPLLISMDIYHTNQVQVHRAQEVYDAD